MQEINELSEDKKLKGFIYDAFKLLWPIKKKKTKRNLIVYSVILVISITKLVSIFIKGVSISDLSQLFALFLDISLGLFSLLFSVYAFTQVLFSSNVFSLFKISEEQDGITKLISYFSDVLFLFLLAFIQNLVVVIMHIDVYNILSYLNVSTPVYYILLGLYIFVNLRIIYELVYLLYNIVMLFRVFLLSELLTDSVESEEE